MEIGNMHKLVTQKDDHNLWRSKTINGTFSSLFNSTKSSQVFLNLQRKFSQINFEIADILNNDETIKAYGNGHDGRFNVIISPIILKQMEQSISRQIEMENKILRYINENSINCLEGFGGKVVSSGMIFHSDGTVEYWSIPEYDTTNENQKNQNQNQANIVYKGEYGVSKVILKGDAIVRRFLYDNILPLYYLETYYNKDIKEKICDEDIKKNIEQGLLNYLKKKFIGVNISIMDIENNEESLNAYGNKCKCKYSVCISPVLFNEMETNPKKELEVEEKIFSYLNKELEVKNLHKIFEVKTIISGIIFHKDGTLTQWSRILSESNILHKSNKEREEFIIRQINKEGRFTIRKLENM